MKYLILALSLFALTSALMPRQSAPGFSAQAVMPDLSFKKISLSDYAGKFVVLLFYPFDFTYVCPTEILSYASKIEEFRSKRLFI
jgi:alkyl hydroperoxide reductase subunit AhpC